MARQNPRPFPRVARLNESIRHVLAEAVARIEDDRLEFVSINDVRVTRVCVFARAGRARRRRIRRAAAAVRAAVGREVRMRITPELVISRDTTIQASQRLEELLANPVAPPDPDLM